MLLVADIDFQILFTFFIGTYMFEFVRRFSGGPRKAFHLFSVKMFVSSGIVYTVLICISFSLDRVIYSLEVT